MITSNLQLFHFFGHDHRFKLVHFRPFFLFANAELFFNLADAGLLILLLEVGSDFVDCLLQRVPFFPEETRHWVYVIIVKQSY